MKNFILLISGLVITLLFLSFSRLGFRGFVLWTWVLQRDVQPKSLFQRGPCYGFCGVELCGNILLSNRLCKFQSLVSTGCLCLSRLSFWRRLLIIFILTIFFECRIRLCRSVVQLLHRRFGNRNRIVRHRFFLSALVVCELPTHADTGVIDWSLGIKKW